MKGMVLRNCGTMGLDWNAVSLSGYLEALSAETDDAGGPSEVSEGLRRFMSAHGVAGHA